MMRITLLNPMCVTIARCGHCCRPMGRCDNNLLFLLLCT